MAGIYDIQCKCINLVKYDTLSLSYRFFSKTFRCIQIRNLHKVYATKKGDCCAVNSLQLTLYENQILALLGKYGSLLLTYINLFCLCL